MLPSSLYLTCPAERGRGKVVAEGGRRPWNSLGSDTGKNTRVLSKPVPDRGKRTFDPKPEKKRGKKIKKAVGVLEDAKKFAGSRMVFH